jgi:hypothetical protein
MQKISFYSLERPIQDRFIQSTHGKEVPAPLLYRKAPHNPVARAFTLVALGVLLGGGIFSSIGFGKLDHRWAFDPRWAVFVYCGVVTLALAALLRAVLLWDRDASLPFLRGLFLYPVGVVDARREVIVIHVLTELEKEEVVGSTLRLHFKTGATFEFTEKDKSRLEQVCRSVADGRQRLSQSAETLSQRDQVLQNPLMDTGFRNPFGPKKPILRVVPDWSKYWLLIALGVGLPLGFGMFLLRNVLSEKHMYALARQLDSSAGYRGYLRRGGTRRDVTDILLPRAELRDARASQTVAAVETFFDTHQNSKIKPEIEAALRVVLLTALEKAREQGTISALREFRAVSKHVALVGAELGDAEKSLFRVALGKYLSAVPVGAEQRAFFMRLLDYSRNHGPKVEVRFRRLVPADAVQRAEVQLMKSAYYMGPAALPGQYFGPKYAEPREAAWVAALAESAAKLFPKDVLSLELGSAVPDDASTAPAVQVPTILITHRTELSGVFLTRSPRGAFVGLSEQYKAHFSIPGEAATLDFQHSTWMTPSPKKLEEAGLNYKTLYDMMAKDGLGRFLKKYSPTLFGST